MGQTTWKAPSSPHSVLSSPPLPGTPSSPPSVSVGNSDSLEDNVFSYDSDIDLPFSTDVQPTYHQTMGFSNSFVGSLCLMVVLFSFALFLPTFIGAPVSSLPSSPAVVEPFRTGRSLLAIDGTSPTKGISLPELNLTDDFGQRLTLDHVLADENLTPVASTPLDERCLLNDKA